MVTVYSNPVAVPVPSLYGHMPYTVRHTALEPSQFRLKLKETWLAISVISLILGQLSAPNYLADTFPLFSHDLASMTIIDHIVENICLSWESEVRSCLS
jgi:hypothetical protein